jgi:rubrerythrin
MISLDDIRICDNCGNVMAKKLADKVMIRCPACRVWKKQAES